MKTPLSMVTVAILATLEINNCAYSAPLALQPPTNFTGAGCPTAQSIKVTGANTNTLSLSFTAYDAGTSSTRTTCEFTLRISASPGYQVASISADWQGFVQGQARFKRKYLFSGENSNPVISTSVFSADQQGETYLEQDVLPQDTRAPNCGGSRELQVQSSMLAKSDDSYITANTTERQHKTIFKVKEQRCQ